MAYCNRIKTFLPLYRNPTNYNWRLHLRTLGLNGEANILRVKILFFQDGLRLIAKEQSVFYSFMGITRLEPFMVLQESTI